MLTYCRKLEFLETPDYDYLRSCIRKMMHQFSYKNDYMYSWSVKEKREQTIRSEIFNKYKSHDKPKEKKH